jgi:S-adenosylmethionine decarboxylase
MDYRVRGFTRDVSGKKLYIDHKINSIQNYIAESTKELYQMLDVNVYQENIFHTKMILKETELENYLFEKESNFTEEEKEEIQDQLQEEMAEIFYGRNIS